MLSYLICGKVLMNLNSLVFSKFRISDSHHKSTIGTIGSTRYIVYLQVDKENSIKLQFFKKL